MANYKILFSDLGDNYNFSCSSSATDPNNVSIDIEINGHSEAFLMLDISTAIKFAKTLRTEINKAKELQEQLRNAEALKNQIKLF